MRRAYVLRYPLALCLFAVWALGGATVDAESARDHQDADSSLPILSGNGYFNVNVTSLKGARFKNVVRQRYDFSCGAAAVATLLTYHYGRPTTEKVVFADMYNRGDKEKIHKEGFSLLDMKRYLSRNGYRAEGYRVGLDKLVGAEVPGIVLINTKGYLHFVVVKGVRDGKVLVADPALGNKVIPRTEFEKMWNGLLFVVLDDSEKAKEFFNVVKDWQVRQKAPIGEARRGPTSIGDFMLMIPGRDFF